MDLEDQQQQAAAEAAARHDTKLHQKGLIELSVATRLANAAVLAATHK